MADTDATRKTRRRPVSPHVTIEVSQGMIDSSIRRNDNHRMIAEAIHQKLPMAKNIAVDLATIRWTDPVKRLRYTYLTPPKAQKSLIDFDRGINPSPFALEFKRAMQITRGHGAYKGQSKTEAERREADRRQAKVRRSRTVNDPELQEFRMSVEESNGIMAAMDDPQANLGPASIHVPAGNANVRTSIPVVVGGKAPLPGQLGHSRRFGIRQMIE